MAAFNAMGLGMLLGGNRSPGAPGSTLMDQTRRRLAAPAPGPTDTSTAGPVTPAPPDATTTGSTSAGRQRKRAAVGSSGTPVLRRTPGQSTLIPQVEPRSLLGY